MTIDKRLASTDFPLPAIREVNLAKHPTGISLGLGELKNFPVDSQIIESITGSFNADGASYTHNAGLPALRMAVANAQSNTDRFTYTQEHVVITIGVQNAIYSTIKTLAKLGAKRVLIPEIFFGIYKKIPGEFCLDVLTYPLNPDFGINTKALSELIVSDDVVLINSPANPTGRVFSYDEQEQLAQLFKQKLTHGYVISDEIYGRLVYEGEKFRSFSAFFNRTIVVDGISKSGAVAGLRVGWVITQNEKLAKAITSNNATVISSPPTANQYGALPIVNGKTQNTINSYNAKLKFNCNYVANVLRNMNIPFVKPTGSFYIFPKLDDLLGNNIKAFCIATAKAENGVVLIPGAAFGAPEYIRISLASHDIEEGMARFVASLKSYKG